jgi:putative membrane protein
MFIDYVGLLLVNMTAGFAILAGYVFRGIEGSDSKRWAPAFGLVGFVALLFGSVMCFTWPLPGPYSLMYGEMSVLFGSIFLAAGIAMAYGWDLSIIAVYAFFAGAAAVVLGARIISLKLTLEPVMAGAGFIISGLCGIFAAPTLFFMRTNRVFRTLGAIVLVLAALIWAATVYPEYWVHPKLFQHYMPASMQHAPPK